ncbi:hypothetical protein WN55_08540 [Dufourea novaeangliae]|uniref:Uncharacterized protein n=1 Tax=Dufourea novaeangliae TaxID=178035 RepID=A0A154P7I6_DUFNO|nr:hypothetical protein WN55_08540 [Dufourea novaeangliae]
MMSYSSHEFHTTYLYVDEVHEKSSCHMEIFMGADSIQATTRFVGENDAKSIKGGAV